MRFESPFMRVLLVVGVTALLIGCGQVPPSAELASDDEQIEAHYPTVTLATVADRSSAIVIGTISTSSTKFVNKRGSQFRDLPIAVTRWVKGEGPSRITLREAGGVRWNEGLHGTTAVFFLSHDAGTYHELRENQFYLTFGRANAVYAIQGDAAVAAGGKRISLDDLDGLFDSPLAFAAQLDHSFDDGTHECVEFEGDGRADDTRGIDGRRALTLRQETVTFGRGAGGQEIVCAIGAAGDPTCSFRDGRWLHVLVDAQGNKTDLGNSTSYRVHAGEVDAWLWRESGGPQHTGVVDFSSVC